MLEVSLAKRGEVQGFQQPNLPTFSMEKTQRHLIKHRNRPSYRRICVYFKSPKQYQKERQRRPQELKLLSQGCSFLQIAKVIVVSKRTVKRDLKKVERYIKGQINSKLYQKDKEQQAELNKLSDLELFERYKALTCLMLKVLRAEKQRLTFEIILNQDDMRNGFPTVTHSEPGSISLPFTFNLFFIKDGVKR